MLLAGDDAAPACCAAGAAVGGDWARSCVGKKEAIIITRSLIIGCPLCGVPNKLANEGASEATNLSGIDEGVQHCDPSAGRT